MSGLKRTVRFVLGCSLPRSRLSGSRLSSLGRSLAVASHASGFADPRHGIHSPGFRGYEGDGGDQAGCVATGLVKTRPVAKIIPLSRRRRWLLAAEIGHELVRLGSDTTGQAEELRATLTDTTDDLPW